MSELNDDKQKSLRAMLDAKREYDAASTARDKAWREYLKAQERFTGKWSSTEHPLGPFVVGDVLIEHEPQNCRSFPPTENVFDYRKVTRCPTSE